MEVGFSGPVDAARRHLAEQRRTLSGLLRAGAVVLGAMLAISPFSGGLRQGLLIYGTGVALHVAHLIALRAGRTRPVAISHCLLYLIWATGIFALQEGGLRAPAAAVYPPLVLMTGLVWSGRAAIGMAVAVSAAGAGLVLLERSGLLPPVYRTQHPFTLWSVLTACVVITAVILRFALGIIRRSNSDALRSQQHFSDLVGAAPDAMFFANSDHVIDACNPASEQIAGRPANILLGLRLEEFLGTDDAQKQALVSYLADTAGGRVKPPIELGLSRPDGGVLPVEVRARTIKRDGRPEVHLTIRDLTDRVKADAERQRLENQLRQAQRLEALGRLAGGVAHDFNNLLTIILGNVGMVSIASDDPRVTQPLEEIEAAAGRAAQLTRQLLAFGRRQVLAAAFVDVNQVLIEMEGMLRLLLPEDVTLEISRAAVIPAIATDRVQLEQVILNLVANARDALPGGGKISVSTSAIPPASLAVSPDVPGDAVWLTVSDDGVGMSDDVQAHMFEPFFTTKDWMQGTGLGLATVHGIVTQTGGRIFLNSALDRGTSLSIAFRRGVAAIVPELPAAVTTPLTAPAVVLLVEDDPAIRNVAGAILTAAHYRVVSAAGAAEAKTASDDFEGSIDLLLTDVVLRSQSGPSIAASLRESRPKMKILFMSGHAEGLIARKGVLPAGVNFLPKPFTRDSLLARVAGVLSSDAAGEIGVDLASSPRGPD